MSKDLILDRNHVLDAIDSVQSIPPSGAVAVADKEFVLAKLNMWLRSMDILISSPLDSAEETE
jgi:hypothetical protein